MIFSLLLATSLATAALGSAARPHLSTRSLEAVRARTPDVVTDKVTALSQRAGMSGSFSYLHSLVRAGSSNGGHLEQRDLPPGKTGLAEVWDTAYVADILADGQKFKVRVDTGADAVWFPVGNVTCVDMNDTVVLGHGKDCGFDTLFQGAPSGGLIPGSSPFEDSYRDSEWVKGSYAYVNLTVAGIKLNNKSIGLVNKTYWDLHGNSGLMGLTYPDMTRTQQGGLNTSAHHYTVVGDMIAEHSEITSFSMAMKSKSSNEGFLAFGGLPPVNFVPGFASVPMENTAARFDREGLPEYLWYTVLPDAYVYEGYHRPAYNETQFNYTVGAKGKEVATIVDTSTYYMYLYHEVVANVSRLFDPPAILFNDDNYWAPCNATAPKFGVKLGGQTIWVAKENMLVQAGATSVNLTGNVPTLAPNSTGGVKYCPSGLQQTSPGDWWEYIFVLGTTFLNNVVTVYDVGAAEMRFAALAE